MAAADSRPVHASEPVPAGALPRFADGLATGLAHVDLRTLLQEVWDRVQRGELSTTDGSTVMLGDAIAERLGSLLDVHENRFAPQRFHDLFWAFHRSLDEPRPPIIGKTWLDVGCGGQHPLGWALVVCMLGAARATAVDLDVVQEPERAGRGLVRLAEAMLQNPARLVADHPITRDQVERNLASLDLAAIRRGEPAGLGTKLAYVRESATALSLADGSVDVVTSNSFLEHVEDLDGVLAELARVTGKGGFGVHGIDGADHRCYVDGACHQLAFLREPGRGWFGNSNRIRPLDYPAVFARHGFTVQQILPRRRVPLTDAEIAGFAAPWSAMTREALEVVCATVVVRRQ